MNYDLYRRIDECYFADYAPCKEDKAEDLYKDILWCFDDVDITEKDIEDYLEKYFTEQ